MQTPDTASPSEKPRRLNGKRSFSFVPAHVIAAGAASNGYKPLDEIQALLALGWIFRQLMRWKPRKKVNVYALMSPVSGGNTVPPIFVGEGSAFGFLQNLMSRLARQDLHPDFVRFAHSMLGYRALDKGITVPVRVPPGMGLFSWLGELAGSRLKESPNTQHPKAVWLGVAKMFLNLQTGRWSIIIHYSYRHDDSSWSIGLVQDAGEKLEVFEARAWAWLRDQIQWRHEERFYAGFFASADGMKKSELKANARAEREMRELAKSLRKVFAWGAHAPGFWENDVAEALLEDADPQYRLVKHPNMTGARLRTLMKWIREDKKAAGEAARAKLAGA